MLLKYTDHLYDKRASYTGTVMQEWTSEMVLNFFPRISKLPICDLCVKIVSRYILYHEVRLSVSIHIISWGDCINTDLENSLNVFARIVLTLALIFYTLPLYNGRVLWFHVRRLSRTSLCPSVFRFRMITWVNIDGFSPNLVCALILWRSGLGLLMGKFRQILTELPVQDTPIFLFTDDNLSKRQWIFTKLGMCIDIVEIWIWIANGQISSNLDGYLPETHSYFCCRTITWVKVKGF